MLWRWRKNDCPECGDIEPPSNVNLEVTQLDVNDFPLWVKFLLVKSQGWGEGLEDLCVYFVVLSTAAIILLPPFSKRFDQLTGVAPADPAPTSQSKEGKGKDGKAAPNAKAGPVKGGGALKWSGDLARSPQKGDTVLSYPVTSKFGPRDINKQSATASKDHKGVDVGTEVGVPLFAMGLPGSKVKVACNETKTGGNQAFVRSDSIPSKEFSVAHLSECKPGVYDAGKVFGKTGNTGSATTGPHLHFEERDLGSGKPVVIPPAKGHIVWMLQGTPPALPSQGPAPLNKALEGSPVLPKVNGDGSEDAQPIYDKLMPSVVQVLNGLTGSGFVISEDGKVLTNWHVVDNAASKAAGYTKGESKIKFADGKIYPYKILRTEKNLDIALIQIIAPAGTTFTPLKFAADLPKLGDDVFAVTSQEGKFPHKTRGKIVGVLTVGEQVAQIETSSKFIKNGASGSAGVNAQGEIVMQNKAILQAGGGKDIFGREISAERDGNGVATTVKQLQEFIR